MWNGHCKLVANDLFLDIKNGNLGLCVMFLQSGPGITAGLQQVNQERKLIETPKMMEMVMNEESTT
jgi:hypothetical protein